MQRTRMLVLGIDGASPDLLLEWSANGTLPNLGSLLERGRSSRMEGLDGFFIGSTWPSIYTGVTPARHGFHYLAQLRPGSYEFYRPADHGLFGSTPFWSALSRAGRKVAILDAPLSPLDPSLNGMQVVEWGGHDSVYGFATRPAELAESIRTRFGDHPVGTLCDGSRKTAEEYSRFVDGLVRGVETKSQMTRQYLRQGGWDLFMQVFSEAHCAGHQCWHLHDAMHPAYDASLAVALGDPMKRVYRAIDEAIGQILEEAGDCMTFVFSSHGMSHWYGAHFLLPEVLFHLGVAQRPAPPARSVSPGSLAVAATSWTWHRLPGSIRNRLRGLRERYGPREPDAPVLPSLDVDVGRSQCFLSPNGLAASGIRLNLAQREPEGILNPGSQADEFCQALTDDLMEIVDERSGRPWIRRVLRVSDHYQGPRLADLPDLVVEYDDAIPTGSSQVGGGRGASVRVRSPKIGVLEGKNTYGRTGEHRPQGLLIAAGPDVERGSFSSPLSLLDLAPTWTRLLGVELGGVDGAPIEGLSPIL